MSIFKLRLLFSTVLSAVILLTFYSYTVSASTGVLGIGAQGTEVRTLQENLKSLGFFKDNVTGYYGDKTAAAVKSLQARNGLLQDGIAGRATQELVKRLMNQSTEVAPASQPAQAIAMQLLKKGMQGNNVTSLQNSLKKLGYFSGTATGFYGDLTVAAVKRFQAANKLEQDGIAGNATINLINRLIAAEQPVARSGSVQAPTYQTLKKGMQGSAVSELQRNLIRLDHFSGNVTGYFGSVTEAAVKDFQRTNGLTVDGVAGSSTLSLISNVLGGQIQADAGMTMQSASLRSEVVSRGGDRREYLMSWFGGADKVYAINKVATIYDIATGMSFQAKRTYGYNHADCEPLTAEDTAIMKKIYNGIWSWNRRAVIVIVDGRPIAASMAGMPHAGVDSAAANAYVSARSGGYGAGANLDAVKGNNMDGHFDIHFHGSKTHGTNRVDENHQKQVSIAADWAARNY